MCSIYLNSRSAVTVGALFLLFIILDIACARDGPSHHTFVEADMDQVHVVKVGDKITLRLSVQPSLGYVWRADVPSGLAQTAPTRFERSSEQRHKLGLPEVQIFEFMAKKSGLQQLRVSYLRIDKVVKTGTFKLEIR